MIASKVPIEYVKCFLKYAHDIFIVEQEVVHKFFKKEFNLKETELLSPATLSYTSYLLYVCSNEPVEVATAAVLLCFWVYNEV
ncbi:MAG: hypothetical protein MRQ09_04415 [Candidatus Midichloria sp.]|nr:hypothetical protein [Candidatus Midichloria sp.]